MIIIYRYMYNKGLLWPNSPEYFADMYGIKVKFLVYSSVEAGQEICGLGPYSEAFAICLAGE